MQVLAKFELATYAAGDYTIDLKLYNATDVADVANSGFSISLGLLTGDIDTQNGTIGSATWCAHVDLDATHVIQIWGGVSALPSDGSVRITGCKITAIRLG
jgi:hypothetical protein